MEIVSKHEFAGENNGKSDEGLQIFRKIKKKRHDKKAPGQDAAE